MNTRDESGCTALIYTVIFSRYGVVRLLLEAIVSMKDNNGRDDRALGMVDSAGINTLVFGIILGALESFFSS